MPWIRRRRYDPRYDPYYYERRAPGSSCLRDACLLETGCCLAEGLDGNCLMLTPRLLSVSMLALMAGPSRPDAPRRRGRVAAAVLGAIGTYQREVSAHRPACCRFSPSCSQYAAQAVGRHGVARGLMLAAGRLVRCRPGGRRGPDPVPA